MDTEYKSTGLFSSAIVLDIPSGFQMVGTNKQEKDATIRNNVEAFSRPGNDDRENSKDKTIIAINLLKRPEHIPTDKEALRWHLSYIKDTMYERGREPEMREESLQMEKVPGTIAYSVIATLDRADPKITMGTWNRPVLLKTFYFVTFIRLKEHNADVVITSKWDAWDYGDELEEDEDGNPAVGIPYNILMMALNFQKQVGKSLEIKDWGMFDQARAKLGEKHTDVA